MFFKHFLLPHVSASRGIIADLTRVRLFRHVMKHMGDDILIRRGVIIKNPENISIGSRVSIQENCYLSGWGGITIGNDVSIGNGTKIVSSEHRYDRGGAIRNQPLVALPVSIRNNVWIGMGVSILGGTHIEDDVIVGAGSLVKGTLESNGIYVGVPAKRIKDVYPEL